MQWALKDPEAACQWVQALPEDSTKLWAQKNVAKNWAQYDPDAAQRWIGSLPVEAKGQVEAFMKEPQKW
ncbi:hypothetical protein [Luteolibacter sp. Populi]|uniref:hypothetical protein n=1 Tax=Luteolibacter sp. Populi TaxID=3230487 RepID=UPI0034669B48